MHRSFRRNPTFYRLARVPATSQVLLSMRMIYTNILQNVSLIAGCFYHSGPADEVSDGIPTDVAGMYNVLTFIIQSPEDFEVIFNPQLMKSSACI